MNVETVATIAISMQNVQTGKVLIIVPATLDMKGMASTAQVPLSANVSFLFNCIFGSALVIARVAALHRLLRMFSRRLF